MNNEAMYPDDLSDSFLTQLDQDYREFDDYPEQELEDQTDD